MTERVFVENPSECYTENLHTVDSPITDNHVKKCVYLDLVFNRLLGWAGGSSCAFWEMVFTQDLAVPPNKVFK